MGEAVIWCYNVICYIYIYIHTYIHTQRERERIVSKGYSAKGPLGLMSILSDVFVVKLCTSAWLMHMMTLRLP